MRPSGGKEGSPLFPGVRFLAASDRWLPIALLAFLVSPRRQRASPP